MACTHTNITSAESGYDIPVFGAGHTCFYVIHVTALVCLGISFSTALSVIISLFKSKAKKTFMTWQKHERFLIYRCICDTVFGFVHSLDHGQMLFTQDHVRPHGLCSFYAFIIVNICISEMNLSLSSAFNAMLSVYFRKNFDFGQNDWKLLVFVFVIPFMIGVLIWALGVLGPGGFLCVFDSVKGIIANIVLSTGLTSVVLLALSVFYVLTWRRIYKEAEVIRVQLGNQGIARSATLKSAKAMCLFVVVYIIQWTPVIIYGTWQLSSNVPFELFVAVVMMTNLSGFFSGIIYLINRLKSNSVSNHTTTADNMRSKTKYAERNKPLTPGNLTRINLKEEVHTHVSFVVLKNNQTTNVS
ncbi:Hypothetical predicted protein [Mytilus galloprovincialis]|uniref:G-protein coupled receptors family 1 profile domain-containing protein n=1 Tax=Mytilus galloprovincialis TaxID=29158 RepID=A0A8B6D0T0_MYTGA|nr:Hypothetical predicted protein [Mytilus galloprovincialis]